MWSLSPGSSDSAGLALSERNLNGCYRYALQVILLQYQRE